MNVEQSMELEARLDHVARASDISLCFEHAFQKSIFFPPMHVSLFGPRLFHALVAIRVEASLLQIAPASYKRLKARYEIIRERSTNYNNVWFEIIHRSNSTYENTIELQLRLRKNISTSKDA